MAFCQNATPPQGPPHMFFHHSSQLPWRVEWVAGFAVWQVVVAALSPHLLNRLLLLSFPQGCSESEEFIHTNLTRNEDNVLGREPIYLFSVGGFCGLKAGMVVYTSTPSSGSTSSQRIWRLPPDVHVKEPYFPGRGGSDLWEMTLPGSWSSLGISCRRGKRPLSDQAVFSLLF